MAQEGGCLSMQDRLTPELLQQIISLSGSLHCTGNLLMPEQADAAAHSGLCQLQAASSIQIPQLCMCLHKHSNVMEWGFVPQC